MFPRRPVFVTGAIGPILGSALIHSVFGIVNPLFAQRLDWPWFIVCQVAFGITAGIVVSRSERLRIWQLLSFSQRAGLEVDETADVDETANHNGRANA